MATMRVEIVELDGHVWSGEAESVVARTLSGDIGILPGLVLTAGRVPLPAQLLRDAVPSISLRTGPVPNVRRVRLS